MEIETIVKSMLPQGIKKWLPEPLSCSELELQLLYHAPILHEAAHLSDTGFMLIDASRESLLMDYNVRVSLPFFFICTDIVKSMSSAQCFPCSGVTTG